MTEQFIAARANGTIYLTKAELKNDKWLKNGEFSKRMEKEIVAIFMSRFEVEDDDIKVIHVQGDKTEDDFFKYLSEAEYLTFTLSQRWFVNQPKGAFVTDLKFDNDIKFVKFSLKGALILELPTDYKITEITEKLEFFVKDPIIYSLFDLIKITITSDTANFSDVSQFRFENCDKYFVIKTVKEFNDFIKKLKDKTSQSKNFERLVCTKYKDEFYLTKAFIPNYETDEENSFSKDNHAFLMNLLDIKFSTDTKDCEIWAQDNEGDESAFFNGICKENQLNFTLTLDHFDREFSNSKKEVCFKTDLPNNNIFWKYVSGIIPGELITKYFIIGGRTEEEILNKVLALENASTIYTGKRLPDCRFGSLNLFQKVKNIAEIAQDKEKLSQLFMINVDDDIESHLKISKLDLTSEIIKFFTIYCNGWYSEPYLRGYFNKKDFGYTDSKSFSFDIEEILLSLAVDKILVSNMDDFFPKYKLLKIEEETSSNFENRIFANRIKEIQELKEKVAMLEQKNLDLELILNDKKNALSYVDAKQGLLEIENTRLRDEANKDKQLINEKELRLQAAEKETMLLKQEHEAKLLELMVRCLKCATPSPHNQCNQMNGTYICNGCN